MTKSLTIKQYLDSNNVNERILSLMTDKGKADQFKISILSLVNADSKLQECDPGSILSSALTATAMNLPINSNLGYVYMIPYKDRQTDISYAQLQFGYKAFVQLAIRSGQFKTINVTDVREGELKGVNRLSGEYDFEWIEEGMGRETLPIIGYVAFFSLHSGFSKSFYMTGKELRDHGTKFSSTYKRGFGMWKDDFDSMAKKTVIKLLLSKYAPLTTEMQRIQEADQAVVTEKGFEYIDNKKITPEEDAESKELKRIEDHIENANSVEQLEMCRTAVEDSGNDELKIKFGSKYGTLVAREEKEATK